MNNVSQLYIEHNESTERYYVKLRHVQQPQQVASVLWWTLANILEPYRIDEGEYAAWDCQSFNEQYTEDVRETYDDFLAGTGRMK